MINFSKKAPFWYWIVSVIAVIWNAIGVYQYIGQAFETEYWKDNLTIEKIKIVKTLPAWIIAAYAIAVFGGVLGSIGLVLRKQWSIPLFWASFVAVAIQMGYLLSLTDIDNLSLIISIIAFATFLVWFSMFASRKGWIGKPDINKKQKKHQFY